ncbi:EB module family protein [Loa loa]|uniref:EB module family protein n=1 Tax=Loa loa TaxID=7209 RepID=A0A1I7W219_LOALO|nr:EB module family protein [Loa loa]EJD75416.1 EB module family protein [Loa loa]
MQILQVPPGGSCLTDRNCKGGSKCRDGWCICPEASMKVIDFNCEKVYSDPLLTLIQNNSSATNSLTSDNRIMIPRISLSALSIAPASAKMLETIERPATFPTFVSKLHVDSLTSSTVSLQYVGDVQPAADVSQWKTATAVSTINDITLATSIPIRLPGQPRITGPPLRRPRPQTATVSTYKIQPGNGICPTPDNVVRDESTNYLIICNGEKPLCPPNSYCYVTGYADQEYNCCRS